MNTAAASPHAMTCTARHNKLPDIQTKTHNYQQMMCSVKAVTVQNLLWQSASDADTTGTFAAA